MACYRKAPGHYRNQCQLIVSRCIHKIYLSHRSLKLTSKLLSKTSLKISRGKWVNRHFAPLMWRHDGRDGVSNHQPHDCLLYRSLHWTHRYIYGAVLIYSTSKKLCVWSAISITRHGMGRLSALLALCAGKPPVTVRFPTQRASKCRALVYLLLLLDSISCLANNRIASDSCRHNCMVCYGFITELYPSVLSHWYCTNHVTIASHDGVIKWKHFPCYSPFVRGIHRWPLASPDKGH